MTETDQPERYEERTYYQAVCTHGDCKSTEKNYRAFTPRLVEASAGIDVKTHTHDESDMQILSYECVGGISPAPDEKPDLSTLLTGEGDESEEDTE